MAITGEGLAMAGVGYDLGALSVPKFGSTTTNPKKMEKKALKRALAEKEEKEMEMEMEETEKKRRVAAGCTGKGDTLSVDVVDSIDNENEKVI
jgi:hypothetical protein